MSGGMFAVIPTRRTAPAAGAASDGGGACDFVVWHPETQAITTSTAPTTETTLKHRRCAITIAPFKFGLFAYAVDYSRYSTKGKETIHMRPRSPFLA